MSQIEQYENLYSYYRLAMNTDQNNPLYETYRNAYIEMSRSFFRNNSELRQDDFFEYVDEREEAERETEPEYSDSEEESDDELWEDETPPPPPPPLYEEVSTPPPYDFLPPPPYR